MTIKTTVKQICKEVKSAAASASLIKTEVKNAVLKSAGELIAAKTSEIIAANQKDIDFAKKNNLGQAKIDRLTLTKERIYGLIKSLNDIAALPDPVGRILYETTRENGLHIRRVTTPIGILLAIFEARPNVAIDIAALALKSGNAAILRSGSESINSSRILIEIFREALAQNGLDQNLVHLINETDRDYVKDLLKMDQFIDVVIPRGGKGLIEAVSKGTKIPIFKHLDGNCHTYIHAKADFDKARKILKNAKMRRVSICGATESLVIDKAIAGELLPLIANDLSEAGCEMRGDNFCAKIDSRIKLASNKDYASEYLDKIISIKSASSIGDAIKHVNKNSSLHTEAIITEDQKAAERFLNEINSAIVMHNASTQFADGGEFGLGAEVGISTGKMHARGPVGLEQLVTYKYIVDANCAIRP